MDKQPIREYRTSEAQRRATKRYEESLKANPVDRERRNRQKLFSSAKSFILKKADPQELNQLTMFLEERQQFFEYEQLTFLEEELTKENARF